MEMSDFFCTQAWAILPAVGEKWRAATRQTPVVELSTPAFASTPVCIGQADASLAVLPIRGVILPYHSPWAALLGATCLDQLTEDFCQARDNPDIQSIVLAIDSPGGIITGIHAFSQLVFAARSQKPIVAVVSGLAASAAYWIAAAASQVWVDPTASVGSIGVIATYQDTAERDKKAGIQRREIISSQSPYKRPDLTTDTGRSQLQQHVDALAAVFVAAVAHYRNVPQETVLSDFGQGGLVVGAAAVTHGLADKVHTFLDGSAPLFNHLTGDHTMSTQPTKTAFQQYVESEAYQTHQATIKALLAEEEGDTLALYDQGFAAGLETGKAEERARIQAIEAQSLPGHDALIQQLKFDGVSTAETAALHLLAAEKAQQVQRREALMADTPPPLSPISAEIGVERSLSFAEKCQREWENSHTLQAEFLQAATYVAYREAEASGFIKTPLKEQRSC